MFRGAVLDALAHEFKTPLATIITAAGGLKEGGSLSPEQTELAEMVESEALRLGQLSSRLLRLEALPIPSEYWSERLSSGWQRASQTILIRPSVIFIRC